MGSLFKTVLNILYVRWSCALGIGMDFDICYLAAVDLLLYLINWPSATQLEPILDTVDDINCLSGY